MRRLRHPRLIAVGLGAAALLAVALRLEAREPGKTITSPSRTFVRHASIRDADTTGAIVAHGTRQSAYRSDGTIAWSGPDRGSWVCARCPSAVSLDGSTSIDEHGRRRHRPLPNATTAYAGLLLRRADDGLEVMAPDPDGPIALGTLGPRSLDPAAYAFAPSIRSATDRTAATAVVGHDDPLAVGDADAYLLRHGRAVAHLSLRLDDPEQPPAPCRPRTARERRWGLVTTTPGAEPWLGTALFVPVAGTQRGEPRSLQHPYSECMVTTAGFVLVAESGGPMGNYPAVAWLDRRGRVIREQEEREVDTFARVSVSDDGTVVMPKPSGFDVITPVGRTRHLGVDDARIAADGTVWTVKGTTVRRITR